MPLRPHRHPGRRGGDTYPSSPGQLELGRLLTQELRALGLRDAAQDEHGIVLATMPATVTHAAPTIAWIAHVDTSPETSGHNVKPIVHAAYPGGDIVLPGDPSKVLRVADNPELAHLKGKTLITTDGTTLLGADDKAGVAVIMEAAAQLLARPETPHGPIRVCFTCDEEIGHGVDHVDLKELGAQVGYTLDGGGRAKSTARRFPPTWPSSRCRGVNIHPSIGKGRMVNAVRLAGLLLDRLPRPACRRKRPPTARAFCTPTASRAASPRRRSASCCATSTRTGWPTAPKCCATAARTVTAEFPQASIDVEIIKQYRNMADGLGKEPRAVTFAEEAMRRAGLEPKLTIVRGGTDGSRLTEMGLPTPNLSSGEHNLHSPLEWTCLEEMATAVRVLVELARVWGEPER